jgi:hypothetical protein
MHSLYPIPDWLDFTRKSDDTANDIGDWLGFVDPKWPMGGQCAFGVRISSAVTKLQSRFFDLVNRDVHYSTSVINGSGISA